MQMPELLFSLIQPRAKLKLREELGLYKRQESKVQTMDRRR